MARPKAGEVNKSQAVREYIATHKRAKAATVVAALAEQGIKVPASLVYGIRGKNRTKRGTLKTGRGAKTGHSAKTSANGLVSLESLVAAKKLVAQTGGIEAAQEALRVLEKLAL